MASAASYACISIIDNAKYVNMVDVNTRRPPLPDEQLVELVELLFFAYRDFTADPDTILSALGFGRAHHRVLHFVGRNPGMRVAELLDILQITKQSLGRVLRELIERGYVVQEEGLADRRQRLLYLTSRGANLHRELMTPQLHRIRRALDRSGHKRETLKELLLALLDAKGRDQLRDLMSRARHQAEAG